MLPLLLSAATLVLMACALVTIITSEEWRIKHLPKIGWALIVIFLPLLGSILWFAIGREYDRPTEAVSFGDPRRREAARPVEVVDDDEAIEREIAFHENQARIRRLEAELRAKREQRPDEG